MIKHNQVGAANGLLISLIFSIMLLVGAAVFGGWAYSSRQDYKNNVDIKIADAVAVAKKEEAKRKDAEFVEAEKRPLRSYIGPSAFGAVRVAYPKTWSVYVNDTGGTESGAAVDGFFHPKVVPAVDAEASVFALRIQVVNEPYAEVVRNLGEGQEAPVIKAYALPKVPDVIGIKATGKILDDKSGTMVVLPLRAQTLQIWTDGQQFVKDFESIILPNLSFTP
jgi:hypothetical protein